MAILRICVFLVMCVPVTSLSIASIPDFENGVPNLCYTRDLDAISIIHSGTVWDRRCHVCNCSDGVIDCVGPECKLKYEDIEPSMCTEWSDDGCCCLHVGCIVYGGQRVDLDEWYQDPRESCMSCKCGPYRQPCERVRDSSCRANAFS